MYKYLAYYFILLFLANIECKSIRVKKCCEEGSHLNVDHKCETGNKDTQQHFRDAIKTLRKNEAGPLEILRQNEAGALDIQIEWTPILGPMKLNELQPTSILSNGTIIFSAPRSTAYYCLDLTQDLSGIIDGLHAVIGNDAWTQPSGFVTKCCPIDSILDENYQDCVKNPSGQLIKIPSRALVSPLTNLPFSNWAWNMTRFSMMCSSGRMQPPIYPIRFVTNGYMDVKWEGIEMRIKYQCFDRIKRSSNEMSAPAALICSDMKERFGESETVLVKKCCPQGMVLDDWYRCVKHHAAHQEFEKLIKNVTAEMEYQITNVGITCPRIMVREVLPQLLLGDGKLQWTSGGNTKTGEYGCLDLPALHHKFDPQHSSDSDSEYHDVSIIMPEILAILCSESPASEKENLAKCCPPGRILNNDLTDCIETPSNAEDFSWIPPRHTWSRISKLPTQQYIPHILDSLVDVCENGATKTHHPFINVLTNGTANFKIDGSPERFSCVDRIWKIDGQISEPNAIRCSITVSKCCAPGNILTPNNTCEIPSNKSLIWTPKNHLFNLDLEHLEKEYYDSYNVEIKPLLEPDEYDEYSDYGDSYNNEFGNIYSGEYEDDELPQNYETGESSYYENPHQKTFIENKLEDEANNTELGGKYQLHELDEGDQFYLLTNGSLLHIHEDNTKEMLSIEEYCMDNRLMNKYVAQMVVLRNGNLTELMMIGNKTPHTYQEPKNPGCEYLSSSLHGFFIFLSVISLLGLLATFIIYIAIKDLQNLHGKIIMGNVVATFFQTICILMVYNQAFCEDDEGCRRLGYFLYFFSMAMFLWMLILCGDLCWTFVRPQIDHSGQQTKKFLMYNLFGWGVAFLMTMLVLIVDESLDDEAGGWDPQVGRRGGIGMCFLNGFESSGLFFYFPILIIMVANFWFFVVTIYTIFDTNNNSKSRQARLSRRGNRSRKSNSKDEDIEKKKEKSIPKIKFLSSDSKEQIILYIKLFMVMGIPWVFEGLHYVSHEDHYKNTVPSIKEASAFDFKNTHTEFTDVFYRIVDVINLLRGLFIFIIFVCKKNIWEKIEKIPWIKKVEKRFPRGRSLSIVSRMSRTLSFGSHTDTASLHSTSHVPETTSSNRMSSAWKRVSNITSVSFRNIKRKAEDDSSRRKTEGDANDKAVAEVDLGLAKDTVNGGNQVLSKNESQTEKRFSRMGPEEQRKLSRNLRNTSSLPVEERHNSLKNALSLPIEQKGEDNLAATIEF